MKNNLCVNSTRLPGIQLTPYARKGQIRCKTIRPLHTLAEAKAYANRLATKLDLQPGSDVSIRLERKSRDPGGPEPGKQPGRRYFFNVTRGWPPSCHVGSQWGSRC